MSTAAEPPSRSGSRRPLILALLVILVTAGAAVALLIHRSSSPTLPVSVLPARTTFDGYTVSPLRAAPAINGLRNDAGQPVTLSEFRGKVVFVTFLYTHCPDVCPLIAAKLHSAFAAMGPKLARHVALISVSVDPHGDTPASVARFLRAHRLTGEMQYLIGTPRADATVWTQWFVGSSRDTSNPSLVNHTAIVYGVSASGKLATVYESTLGPSELVHDVTPLSAS